MVVDKYAWQKASFKLWSDTGFKGILKAPPRSGKTRCGANCIKSYLSIFPFDRVWVVANSNIVLNQWKEELEDVDSIEYFTYPGAVSKFEKLIRTGREKENPDLLVLDECQFVTAQVWGRVLDYGVAHILGLSATPGGAPRRIGPIFQDVDLKSANVADTQIHFEVFTPTAKEMAVYMRETATISSYHSSNPYASYYNDDYMKMIINRRRFTVYNFNSRIPIAINLIERNKDRKVLVFCMHTKQIEKIAKELDKLGFKYCVHYTGKEELSEFTSGNVNICLTCRKINIGFNYPEADVGIMVSTALSADHLIQTAYRVMTQKEGKKADVYILLADGTSDMEATKKGIYIPECISKEKVM